LDGDEHDSGHAKKELDALNHVLDAEASQRIIKEAAAGDDMAQQMLKVVLATTMARSVPSELKRFEFNPKQPSPSNDPRHYSKLARLSMWRNVQGSRYAKGLFPYYELANGNQVHLHQQCRLHPAAMQLKLANPYLMPAKPIALSQILQSPLMRPHPRVPASADWPLSEETVEEQVDKASAVEIAHALGSMIGSVPSRTATAASVGAGGGALAKVEGAGPSQALERQQAKAFLEKWRRRRRRERQRRHRPLEDQQEALHRVTCGLPLPAPLPGNDGGAFVPRDEMLLVLEELE
jgi:hypothetical protein